MSYKASAFLLVACALLVAPAASAPSRCPPPGFNAVPDLNISAFIAERWYVQQQEPLVYQSRANLFCVFAEYEPVDSQDLVGKGLVVNNYANKGVNGQVVGTSEVGGGWLPLLAIPNKNYPSKLKVGFAAYPTSRRQGLSRGDYWVVAVGQSDNIAERSPTGYDWAIISGGAPGRRTSGGCATGSSLALLRRFQTNNIGLWLFSRKAIDAEGTQAMLAKVAELGLDPSGLVPVTQEGCTYRGAPGQGSGK